MDLTALINTYRGPLIGLIASWGAPWADASEIAQDSFSEAWLNRESCRGDWKEPEVFGRWLRGVALNQHRNWARSRRRRSRVVTLVSAGLESVAAPPDPEPSEDLEALRYAIDRLPARQRQVVLMHYLEETRVNDIAVLLSVTARTVEGRLYHAPDAAPASWQQAFGLADRKDAAMPVNIISEDNLRAALRPYRVDPEAFETGVRERLKAAERERVEDPLARLSPLLRCVAAFLPLQLITGCKMPETAAKAAPAAGAFKLLGYLAFPAISLFVLLGATVLSIAGIRNIREENGSSGLDQEATSKVIAQWWRRHRWGARLVFGATVALAWVGATWLMFVFYIISFGLLLYVLTSFAKLGMGNRYVIASSCMGGLMLLAQIAGFSGIGGDDIHFVDQKLIVPVFFGGAMVLMPLGFGRDQLTGARLLRMPRRLLGGLLAVIIMVALSAWLMNPILWPVTPSRIKDYVESFKEAPFASYSWQQWEIMARWAVESKLNPDLSGARRLLAQEISGKQNALVLDTAFRVGLVRSDQLGQLRAYERRRHSLLDDPYHFMESQPILGLNGEEWVIRASVLRNELSPQERDHLEKRLHVTLEDLSPDTFDLLDTALRVTQLLELIQRPIDRERYRDRVHDWLRKLHCKRGGGFEVGGGFKRYLEADVGRLEATSNAVELMAVYGIPDDLDLNWVRSFVRPLFIRRSPDKWIAAVTRDRLNHLPGVRRPTWLEVLYYERSLVAAVVLVGLCIYATLSSPEPKPQPGVLDSAV